VLVVWTELGMQEGLHTIVWMSQVSLRYRGSWGGKMPWVPLRGEGGGTRSVVESGP